MLLTFVFMNWYFFPYDGYNEMKWAVCVFALHMSWILDGEKYILLVILGWFLKTTKNGYVKQLGHFKFLTDSKS